MRALKEDSDDLRPTAWCVTRVLESPVFELAQALLLPVSCATLEICGVQWGSFSRLSSSGLLVVCPAAGE